MNAPADWATVAEEALGVMKAAADVAAKKAADDIYARILDSAQDYLEENLRFNIASTLATAERERKAAQDRVAGLLATNADLLEAITATRALVAEGAADGFTDHAWMERLFLNQRNLSAALAKATGDAS